MPNVHGHIYLCWSSLVTHIENNTLSGDLSEYEAIEDLEFDYTTTYHTSPYLLPTLSPTEDMATSNIFSMSHDIDGKMRITGDEADIEINGTNQLLYQQSNNNNNATVSSMSGYGKEQLQMLKSQQKIF